ncbi:MAG: rhomboid family intramembrane serine protease [Pseudomonadota bacterium]
MARPRRAEPLPIGSIAVTLLVLALGFVVVNGDDPSSWYQRFGLVPIVFWQEQAEVSRFWAGEHWFTPLTSIFIHLDWVHLLGNLAFFWLFAQRIERRTGWIVFLAVVVAGGVFSSLVSAAKFADSAAPIIGASGATAALLGAFLVLYPAARLGVVLPLGVYLQMIRVPGLALIGTWFLIQVLYTLTSSSDAAIAWWSHIAGFLSGLLLAGFGRMFGFADRPRRAADRY